MLMIGADGGTNVTARSRPSDEAIYEAPRPARWKRLGGSLPVASLRQTMFGADFPEPAGGQRLRG